MTMPNRVLDACREEEPMTTPPSGAAPLPGEIVARVARLLGHYGVAVQDGNLAPDQFVVDELCGLEAAITTALAQARQEQREAGIKAMRDYRAATKGGMHAGNWHLTVSHLEAAADWLAQLPLEGA